MRGAKLREHFVQLADEAHAVVIYTDQPDDDYGECHTFESEPMGTVRTAVALPQPPDNLPLYFVGLHELGHLAQIRHSRGYSLRWRCAKLDCEADAWCWALNNAAVRPTKSVWRRILRSMNSYVREYEHDLRIKPSKHFDDLHLRVKREAA